jgi:integrase
MTGLRRGQALGLRWKDLDFEAQTLKVNQSQAVVHGLRHSQATALLGAGVDLKLAREARARLREDHD